MADDDAEFHAGIGYCITAWARIEERLFEICWKTLQSPKDRAAIIYYRTPTLDARLSLVTELLARAFPKPNRPSGGHPHPTAKWWAVLEKRLRDELATRRRIAHHPVGILQDAEESFALYMSENEQLRGKHPAPYTLGHAQLAEHYRNLQEIELELRTFIQDGLSALPK